MANKIGKHSAPLPPKGGRRPAHSADLGASGSRGRRGRANTNSFDNQDPAGSYGGFPGAGTPQAPRAAASAGRAPQAGYPGAPANGAGYPGAPGAPGATAGSYNAAESLAKARQARKKGRGKKVGIAIAAALAVVLIGAGAAAALYLNNINNTIQDGMDDEQKAELLDALAPVDTGDDAYYVGIFGSDARQGETVSRSDVTMLARIDESTGVVDLISVPRDTMIEIEGQGTQKINAAYAFGGPSGAVKTLSEFAGVPISHYVEIHFDELERVVDELGGITVDIPQSFYSDTSGIRLEAGEQTINGPEALAFARERHATRAGDFSRAQAQRLIIEAIVEKVLQAAPTAIPGIVESLAKCVTTDYTVPDLVSLALTFKDRGLTMYSAACPSYTLNRNGISYVGTQYKEWQDMMRRVDAGLDPADTKAEIPEPQASNEELGAATNASSPQDYKDLVKDAMTTDDVIDVNEKKTSKGSDE